MLPPQSNRMWAWDLLCTKRFAKDWTLVLPTTSHQYFGLGAVHLPSLYSYSRSLDSVPIAAAFSLQQEDEIESQNATAYEGWKPGMAKACAHACIITCGPSQGVEKPGMFQGARSLMYAHKPVLRYPGA